MHLYYFTYRGDFSLFELATSVPRDGIFPSEVYLGLGIVQKSMLRTLGQHKKLRKLQFFHCLYSFGFGQQEWKLTALSSAAGHADELPLLFNWKMFSVERGSSDYPVSKEIVQAFVNFASNRLIFRRINVSHIFLKRNFNATTIYSESLKFWNTEWMQVSETGRKYMKIDEFRESSMVTPPFEKRVRSWLDMKFRKQKL